MKYKAYRGYTLIMNNIKNFSDFTDSTVKEASFFASSSTKKEVASDKQKTEDKAVRNTHRTELMQKRKDILGKISKIKANLENNPVPAAITKTDDIKVVEPAVAVAQLESLRKELREINKLLS